MAISKITSDAIDATGFNLDSDTLTIDSTNNRVGVGTSSPSYPLHVSGNGFGTIAKFSADDGSNNPRLLIYGSSDGMHIQRTSGSGAANLMFDVGGAEGGGTEVARFDASGNLLVGTTTLSTNTDGHELRSDGKLVCSTSGAAVAYFNRNTDNGQIIRLDKDGTTVGSIGIDSGGFYVDGEANHTGLRFKGGAVTPRLNGAQADNTVGLGNATERFSDLYLGGSLFVGGTGSANELDDYEEGTFDIKGSNTGYTLNHTYNRGEYTKIGNVVTCIMYITLASATSGVTFYIDLPFTLKDNGTNSANSATGAIMYNNFNATNGMTDLVIYAGSSSNKARLFQSFDNASWTAVTTNQLTGNESFYCTLTYRTS